jgi:hypothetical protein
MGTPAGGVLGLAELPPEPVPVPSDVPDPPEAFDPPVPVPPEIPPPFSPVDASGVVPVDPGAGFVGVDEDPLTDPAVEVVIGGATEPLLEVIVGSSGDGPLGEEMAATPKITRASSRMPPATLAIRTTIFRSIPYPLRSLADTAGIGAISGPCPFCDSSHRSASQQRRLTNMRALTPGVNAQVRKAFPNSYLE